MDKKTYHDIITTVRSTVFALMWGGLSGITGLGFSAMPLNTAFIFGGIGLFFAYVLNTPLLLLAIHCAYAFFIIRFRFRGIKLVIVVHYLSIIVALTVWTLFDLQPDIWDGVKMCYAAFCDSAPVHNEPLYKVLGPIFVAMVAIPSAIYNGFLLSLLFLRVRKIFLLS